MNELAFKRLPIVIGCRKERKKAKQEKSYRGYDGIPFYQIINQFISPYSFITYPTPRTVSI